MGAPQFGAGWPEVQVSWGPHLQLVSEVGVVSLWGDGAVTCGL